MKKITELFESKINRENKDKEKYLFNSIYNSLEEVYGKSKVDLDSIMSVIVGLKEISELDSIGDLGLFLLRQKGIKNIMDLKYDLESLKSLEKSFKKFIRSKISLKTKDIDRLRERYFEFFKQVCKIY
jgi:hypothetical protein